MRVCRFFIHKLHLYILFMTKALLWRVLINIFFYQILTNFSIFLCFISYCVWYLSTFVHKKTHTYIHLLVLHEFCYKKKNSISALVVDAVDWILSQLSRMKIIWSVKTYRKFIASNRAQHLADVSFQQMGWNVNRVAIQSHTHF